MSDTKEAAQILSDSTPVPDNVSDTNTVDHILSDRNPDPAFVSDTNTAPGLLSDTNTVTSFVSDTNTAAQKMSDRNTVPGYASDRNTAQAAMVSDPQEDTTQIVSDTKAADTLQGPGIVSDSIPTFDTTRYVLEYLCVHHHDYHGTSQSLRRISDGECLECHRVRAKAYRQRRARQASAT